MRVDWSERFSLVSADLGLRQILKQVRTDVVWVVLAATEHARFYAFRRSELESKALESPALVDEPAITRLRLREESASRETLADIRPNMWPPGLRTRSSGPTNRFVALDDRRLPVAIGAAVFPGPTCTAAVSEPEPLTDLSINVGPLELGPDIDGGPDRDAIRPYIRPSKGPSTRSEQASDAAESDPPDVLYGGAGSRDLTPPKGKRGKKLEKVRMPRLGGSRGGAKRATPTSVGAPPSPPTDKGGQELLPAILSARGPKAIAIGAEEPIEVRIELRDGATPFANAVSLEIRPAEPIRVILTMSDPQVVRVVERRVLQLDPPLPGVTRTAQFVVRGLQKGACDGVVTFMQGGTDLGAIRLVLEVNDALKDTRPGDLASVDAVPRNMADDDLLQIIVIPSDRADSCRFKYLVSSRSLGLDLAPFESREFLSRGGSVQGALLAFVQLIYDSLVKRALRNVDDVKLFGAEVKAIGMDLCDQLFAPELSRVLWAARDDIKGIKITTFDPSVPWELMRLQNPDTHEVDDRHLCEYGLIRAMSGRRAAARFSLKNWSTVTATYPNKSLPVVGSEIAELQRILRARGIEPVAIAPGPQDLLNALEQGGYDVLHIACHGRSDPNAIENAEIILSDRAVAGGEPEYVSINARTISCVVPQDKKAPLIFVNACETGRQAASLTGWGGLPSAFWKIGAGAYVGTSWSVRERPAREFSDQFYDALLGGSMLVEAAQRARNKAKLGDASWLAYTVYGDPTSTRL